MVKYMKRIYQKLRLSRYIAWAFAFCLIFAAMLLNLQTAGASSTGLPFTDVSPAAWYYQSVRTVWEHGLFTGTITDTFNPQGEMTRAMFV